MTFFEKSRFNFTTLMTLKPHEYRKPKNSTEMKFSVGMTETVSEMHKFLRKTYSLWQCTNSMVPSNETRLSWSCWLTLHLLTVASVQCLEIFPQQPLIAAELYFRAQRSSSH